MTKIVAFVQGKGGTGKSTLAALVGAELWRRGHDVVLIDADRQGSLMRWYERRKDAGYAEPEVFDMTPNELAGEIPRLKPKPEIVLIDTAGQTDSGNLAAKIANLTIVPLRLAQIDVEATERTLNALQAMGRRYIMLFNAVAATNSRDLHFVEGAKRDGLRVLDTVISQRLAYPRAINTGRGVHEQQTDKVAMKEIRTLGDEILRKLNVTKTG